MTMNGKDVDANIVRFLRVLKRIGLITPKTYSDIGTELMFNGHSKKDKWRKMSWSEYLKNG